MASLKVSVRKGREWQLQKGHPWLFSGAISQAPAKASAGDVVDLVDINGRFIARGFYNPDCDIAVRVLTSNAEEEIDPDFIQRRVQRAVELRQQFIDESETNVYRLINAEGDFLPGIIADRLGDVIVLQSHTAGSDRLVDEIVNAITRILRPSSVIVRNDARARLREKLELQAPRVVSGSESITDLIVRENSIKFKVDPMGGQKTGFFADQRDKRVAVQRLSSNLTAGATIANCFSYSASFSVYAAIGNEQIKTINIDSSADALAIARENLRLNNISEDNHTLICADAFSWLEQQVADKHLFEFVILDPPAFAKTQKDKSNALKAYARLNTLGISCTTAGGYLMTCSCSGCVTLEDLQAAVHAAAGKCGRQVQLVEVFQHGIDHPVNLALVESQYLKVLLCRVL